MISALLHVFFCNGHYEMQMRLNHLLEDCGPRLYELSCLLLSKRGGLFEFAKVVINLLFVFIHNSQPLKFHVYILRSFYYFCKGMRMFIRNRLIFLIYSPCN